MRIKYEQITLLQTTAVMKDKISKLEMKQNKILNKEKNG